MDKTALRQLLAAIASQMDESADALSKLDARNGDGDLGRTMRDAFAAAVQAADDEMSEDLGRILLHCAKSVNAAAPSTSGTILSFWMMGAAKALKGRTEASLQEFAQALQAGIQTICEKARSQVGDKTILDAISPAVDALLTHGDEGATAAARAALEAAEAGVERTRDMLPKHGRAAYYGEKLRGLEDGGAVAGKLMFESACRLYGG